MGLLDDFTEEEIAEEEEVEEVPEEEEEKEKGISLACDSNKKSIPTREKTSYEVKLINTMDSDQEIDLEVRLL